MEEVKTFAEQLKGLRIKNSLSAETVAKKSGISLRHLWYLEAGKYKPSLKTFIKVIEAAGGNPQEMLTQEMLKLIGKP